LSSGITLPSPDGRICAAAPYPRSARRDKSIGGPLNSGFALGAAAALAWGVADVIVTYYSRRIGYLRALVVIHGLSLVPLALLALVVDPPEPVTTGSLVSAAALGPVAVVAYMGFYKALELGPISIVSPIVSAFGAVVVLLALLVLGDSLTEVQAIGCVLVLSCVLLASIETSGSDHAGATGIALSLVACFAFGLYLFLQGELADELGWLLPILVSRTVAVLILCALLAAMPGPEPRHALGRAGVAGCAATGALEASAYLFFNRGAELGEIALTGAAVSAYPVIPILVGLFALRERVARHQLVGVAGVLVGMVVLSLG
jgi:drug/metabolite transporter (DMT)-like permease